jgi:hypothetical protein
MNACRRSPGVIGSKSVLRGTHTWHSRSSDAGLVHQKADQKVPHRLIDLCCTSGCPPGVMLDVEGWKRHLTTALHAMNERGVRIVRCGSRLGSTMTAGGHPISTSQQPLTEWLQWSLMLVKTTKGGLCSCSSLILDGLRSGSDAARLRTRSPWCEGVPGGACT